MKITTQQWVRVYGEVFGARGCSGCSCNPCDCNPCTCGDSVTPTYPAWRISGYLITDGEIHGINVSQHLVLSLAQPVYEGVTDEWQEVILVDQQAMPEQINVLLAACEDRLESIPAEIKTYTRTRRAVYQAPMSYAHSAEGPVLHVAFVQEQAKLIRKGASPAQNTFKPWTYDGPMALRGSIDLDE